MPLIKDVCNNLYHWFIDQEYAGYDPYQLNRFRRSVSKRIPKGRVSLLFLKKLTIPKALGLIIRGNASLYRATGNSQYLSQNETIIQILLREKYDGYEYPAWGWPFSWTSGLGFKYPCGYPLSVVTAEIGHAFLDHYQIRPDPALKAICVGIADALTHEIGFEEFDDEKCCFYYTHLDRYFVINTNAYAASYLARLHSIYSKQEYLDLSLRACMFTISQQQKNGSWYYYAPPFLESNKTIDNRHTGFTIVAMLWANQYLKLNKIEDSIAKGWRFYEQNFVHECMPKYKLNNLFPIDMHDIAQLIITSVECGNNQLSEKCAQWAIENMSDGRVEFYYRMYSDGKITKIPFFRWSQAWMYRALTLMLERGYGNERFNKIERN